MIPVDTLDSVVLRSAFSRIFHTRGFRLMSYALSTVAMIVAVMASYKILTGSEILPDLTGPILAVIIIGASFAYSLVPSIKSKSDVLQNVHSPEDKHHDDKEH